MSASNWAESVTTQSPLLRSEVSTISDSVNVFREASRVLPTDPRVVERLAQVHALVGGDIEWIETSLTQACADGLRPATLAAQHLVARGGKRVRPLTALLAAGCFGPIPHAARVSALVAELVHSSSLLHDDVTDEGNERRGARTSRLLYGNAVSVLAGDLLLIHALEQTVAEIPEVLPDLLGTLRQLIDGEVVQLRGRTELDVRESTYERVLRGKTASLFAWAARAGARAACAAEDEVACLGRFGEHLGIAFQLVDDVLDYDGKSSGKSGLVDLREGKLTLPLVLAVAAQPELLFDVRRIHAGDFEPVEALGRKVVATGSCEVVRRRAVAVTERAIDSLAEIPASSAKELLIEVARELSARIS